MATKTKPLDPRIDTDDWQHIFENAGYGNDPTLNGTAEHREVKYTRADVKTVIAIDEGANDGADWLGVFKMKDGWYLFVQAGCDYTGWGCQEGGQSWTSETKAGIRKLVPIADEARLWPKAKE